MTMTAPSTSSRSRQRWPLTWRTSTPRSRRAWSAIDAARSDFARVTGAAMEVRLPEDIAEAALGPRHARGARSTRLGALRARRQRAACHRPSQRLAPDGLAPRRRVGLADSTTPRAVRPGASVGLVPIPDAGRRPRDASRRAPQAALDASAALLASAAGAAIRSARPNFFSSCSNGWKPTTPRGWSPGLK